MTQPDQPEPLDPPVDIDATFSLHCDDEAHDRPSELWFAREAHPDGQHTWSFQIPNKRHGRDWDTPRAFKVSVHRLRGNTFLTKEMREPHSEFSFSPAICEFTDTPNETERLNFRFECTTCGVSPPVRSEKLARILDRQIAADKPDMTLQGLDSLLKLQH